METTININTIEVLGGNVGKTGLAGSPGQNGVNSPANGTGQNGTDGDYTSGWWSGTCTPATNGTTGASPITSGTNGGTGLNGTAPYLFTLRVDEFLFSNGGNMTINSAGGAGGQGGPGGQGGAGAAGGDAGDTITSPSSGYDKNCLATGKCPPATGGQGGNGGNGGQGGRGGDGGSGGHVTIYYKNGINLNKVIVTTPAGAGGLPGVPGLGGPGGPGGKNEIWPAGGNQTYAPVGNKGVETGDLGGGTPGQAGSITLTQIPD